MTFHSDKLLLQAEKRDKHYILEPSLPLVVLCYPNTYEAGMSSLAFHFLLGSFSARALCVQRAFALPQAWNGRAATMETGQNIMQASAILVSISFEEDYINFLALLKAGGIPLAADQRAENHPFVIAGGGAVSANPMVLSPYTDAIALGEFDSEIDVLAENVEAFAYGRLSREELKERFAVHEHFFVPGTGEDGKATAASLTRTGGTFKPVGSEIVSPFAHFPNTVLIEINRSCVSSCLFCMASYLYRPYRIAEREAVLEICERWKGRAGAVGLVGTALTSYPGFESLCEEIRSMGFSLRLSSLRIEGLRAKTLEHIANLGVRTVTLAPESMSETLRRGLKKNVSDREIEEVLSVIARLPISKTKLYFMYGIPGEREEDVRNLVRFVKKMRKTFKYKKLYFSINCLIPKAWTPLQWQGIPSKSEIDEKRQLIFKLSGRELKERPFLSSANSIVYQAALSLGGAEIARGLELCNRSKGMMVRHWNEIGVNLEELLYREKPGDYLFPWDSIDAGIKKDKLYQEYLAFKGGKR